MHPYRPKFFVPLLAGCLFLGACSLPEPYVFNKDEFNRDALSFGKELKDRDSVEICYNSQSTKPEILRQMAAIECAKFGKRAQFRRHDYLECPVLVPARAIFACLKP